MAEITEETIAELEALYAAAPQGDWAIGNFPAIVRPGNGCAISCAASAEADLIVALRNAAPQLIAAARRSLEYEAFLREHRAALLDSLNYSSARTSGAYRAARDALLERLK